MTEEKNLPSGKKLLKFVCEAKKPPSFTEIAKAFGVPKNERKKLKKELKKLIKAGKVAVRKGRYVCPAAEGKSKKEKKRIVGTVVAYPAGFGFLQSEELEKDLYIPPVEMQYLLNARSSPSPKSTKVVPRQRS